jgi:hypothetical protein
VRRLAKASSAGSTDGQDSSLGSSLREAFATRGAFGEAKGSGAPAGRGVRLRSLALLGLAVALVTALTASPALAVETHPYTGLSFGPDGTAGTSFSFVQGVAVEQSSEDVYVHDAGAGKVYKFDSSGAPVNFSALGGNVIEGVGGSFSADNEIAVAPPGSPGGTAGDIYVASNGSIKIYGANGTKLGELTGGYICGVAVDPAGHVFIGAYPSTVKEFAPTANPVTNADQSAASTGVVSDTCNVAIDGLGNIYAARYSGGVQKLEGLGDTSFTLLDPSAFTVGVDPATNDLFANRGPLVAQYGASGALLGTFGQLSQSRGVAVNGAAEEIYVGNNGSHQVDVFGPATIVPGVATESPSGVTGTKATLHGTVNPDGIAVTDCKFEYGTTAAYGSSKPCEGAIPTDSSDHPITAALTGLTANQTYHLRLVATNANGTNQSSDQTFTTAQPAITNAASGVTGTKATLNGAVLPEGEAVSGCFFEYGVNGNLDTTAPCEGAIPADEGEHPVTAQLTHLAPNGTFYQFRLVIERASGTVNGALQSFQTEATVVTTAATALTGTAATLNGTLNPEGIPYTACSFEYGPTEAYGDSVPCVETPASIGEGTSPVGVHADLSGLTLASGYHYRLVGANADGTARGTDQAFKTLGAAIEDQWTAGVVTTDATLKARINPGGLPTTYHLEYGADASYGQSTAESNVGADETAHTTTSSLQGLTPGATYHWRVVATNSAGVSEGPDRTFTTYALPSAADVNCPNQQFRIGLSAVLPDCRAYEMVTPLDKNNGDILTRLNLTGYPTNLDQSSTDGSGFTYSSYRAFANPQSAPYTNQFLAHRDPGSGWLSESIDPPREGHFRDELEGEYQAFSADLSSAWVMQEGEPTLAPCAPAGITGLYHRDNANGAFRSLNCVQPNLPSVLFRPELQGFSADGSHAVFRINDALTPNASSAGNYQIYESSGDGELHLISALPNGEAATADSSAGTDLDSDLPNHNRFPNSINAMSADGTRVYWSHRGPNGLGPIYLRLNADREQSLSGGCDEAGKACTIVVSSEAARFQMANPDGTKALYVTEEGSLYEFDAEAEPPISTLIADDMRRNSNILGASEDLSRVFYASNTASAAAQVEGAVEGEPNIYLQEGGTRRFVATLTTGVEFGSDMSNQYGKPIEPTPIFRTARVSLDGRHVVFMSNGKALSERVAGYDNTDAVSGQPSTEVYLYDADAAGGVGKLRCVSCNPSGSRPAAQKIAGGNNPDQGFWAAATVPRFQTALFQPRYLSDDGKRVFFNSYDALVLGDTNGKGDVYQWEEAGSGTCTTDDTAYVAASEGCISLLSSGQSPFDSEFLDASPAGADAFFTTAEDLLPQDYGLIDVYDARQEGGFPPPPNLPAACEGEACQSPLEAPSDPTPASATFKGAGNVREGGKPRCAKGKARKKGRCVAKKHKKKAAKKSAKRRANDNRRTGR